MPQLSTCKTEERWRHSVELLLIGVFMYKTLKKSLYFLSKLIPNEYIERVHTHYFETRLPCIFHSLNAILQPNILAIVQTERSPCRTIIG